MEDYTATKIMLWKNSQWQRKIDSTEGVDMLSERCRLQDNPFCKNINM